METNCNATLPLQVNSFFPFWVQQCCWICVYYWHRHPKVWTKQQANDLVKSMWKSETVASFRSNNGICWWMTGRKLHFLRHQLGSFQANIWSWELWPGLRPENPIPPVYSFCLWHWGTKELQIFPWGKKSL